METFENDPELRWAFLTDRVMGGVSAGRLVFGEEDGARFASMSGDVSTANNGGFIQMRTEALTAPLETSGLRLVARGINGPYFIHVRTTDTRRPWQFHQAGFEVKAAWSEVFVPFDDFAARGGAPAEAIEPASITSVAVAAYGRDHSVEIDVREIGFY